LTPSAAGATWPLQVGCVDCQQVGLAASPLVGPYAAWVACGASRATWLHAQSHAVQPSPSGGDVESNTHAASSCLSRSCGDMPLCAVPCCAVLCRV
jgi:hypothetical protein